jgi:hypothetical protein
MPPWKGVTRLDSAALLSQATGTMKMYAIPHTFVPYHSPLPTQRLLQRRRPLFQSPPPKRRLIHLTTLPPQQTTASNDNEAATTAPSGADLGVPTGAAQAEPHQCPPGHRHCTRHRGCVPVAEFRRSRYEYGPIEDRFTYCNRCYMQVGHREGGHVSAADFRALYQSPDEGRAAEHKKRKNARMAEKRRATIEARKKLREEARDKDKLIAQLQALLREKEEEEEEEEEKTAGKAAKGKGRGKPKPKPKAVADQPAGGKAKVAEKEAVEEAEEEGGGAQEGAQEAGHSAGSGAADDMSQEEADEFDDMYDL